MKSFFRNIYYFFPVQLFLVHFKRNQILTIFWFFLFGFISKLIFSKLGAASLFLSPEYFDKVNFWSFFILGLAFGSFVTAFNISSYIVNAHYFPFIATLSKPFLKYSINNFVLPLTFIIIYILYSINFQSHFEFLESGEIAVNILGFMLGMMLFIFIALSYFFTTNKDVYKLYNIVDDKGELKIRSKPVRMIMLKDMKWKQLNSPPNNMGAWRIETYLTGFLRIRRARNFDHYNKEMIHRVLRQNHKNATFFAIGVIILALILGIFMDNKFFMIPAGASVLILFTILVMFYSAIKSLFKEWALIVIVLLMLGANFITQYFFFDFRNSAYGMNYSPENELNNLESMKYFNSLDFQKDYSETISILNKWKEKNTDPQNPEKLPKMVFINTSGGGMKAMIWTYYSLVYADSLLDEELFKHTQLISGASGGMIGAGYFRELYLQKKIGKIKSCYNDTLLNNLSRDILNPMAFSFSLNDWFFKFKKFRYKDFYYYKDRAYSFEKKMNENTNFIMDKTISDYKEPEKESLIPMMIVTPTIINDGRTLIISPQNVSYLFAHEFNKNTGKPANVEFRKLYIDYSADSLRFTTALRMNATFPYVAPIVALPGKPQLLIMDAGIRDNYGLNVSLKFFNTFRDWINQNTSGVVFLQLTEESNQETEEQRSAFVQFLQPLGNVYNNIFNIQEIHNEQIVEYSAKWTDKNIHFISLYLKGREDEISLSWHLTKREKQLIKESIKLPKNQQALYKLKELLSN